MHKCHFSFASDDDNIYKFNLQWLDTSKYDIMSKKYIICVFDILFSTVSNVVVWYKNFTTGQYVLFLTIVHKVVGKIDNNIGWLQMVSKTAQ